MFYKMIENKCKEWYQSDNCTVKHLIDYIEKTGQMRDAQIEAIKRFLKTLLIPIYIPVIWCAALRHMH